MRLSLLEARERRDVERAALSARLREGEAAIFLSLNIPGADKTPPGADAFFAAMRARLLAAFPAGECADGRDALGPFAIVAVAVDPVEAKRLCVGLESAEPCSRLADLDVYAPDGVQIDRARLGLAGRSCLVCTRPAVECIRARRHDDGEVIARAHFLLANFAA